MFDEVEEDTTEGILAVKFIIGRDLAVKHSSPDPCCARFAMAAVQAVEQKWLNVKQISKMIPLIACEIPFGQDVCEWFFCCRKI